MDPIDLTQGIWQLEHGFCLWVGAGLTIQLTGDPALTPNWQTLTTTLEDKAQVRGELDAPFPVRLQKCENELKEMFYSTLRKLYYTDLCHRILEIALKQVNQPSGSIVPKGMRRIACLGQMANPIVNFNIEPLSSIALARPGGAARLLSYTAKGRSIMVGRPVPHSFFRRTAYHPHGLISDGGSCVMTAREYEEKQSSLAFQLAVTSAYGQRLAVVGLGLSEEETHEQIKKYRDDLEGITWFTTREAWESQAKFCREARIDVVLLESWRAFWERWDDIPVAVSEPDLHAAWHSIVAEAAKECRGGRAYTLAVSLSQHEALRDLASRFASESLALGEQGEVRTVEGRDPADVVAILEDKMRALNYEVPLDQGNFGPQRR